MNLINCGGQARQIAREAPAREAGRIPARCRREFGLIFLHTFLIKQKSMKKYVNYIVHNYKHSGCK